MNREKTEPTSILIPQDRSIISPHPESFDTTKKEIRALQNNLDAGVVQNTQSLGVDIVKREGIPLMRQMIARELPPELHAHTPVIERVILEKFSRFLTGNADL